MTRVFLAAGVAALAITAPAVAGPHRDKAGTTAQTSQRAERPARAERVQMRTQRAAAPRVERTQRMAFDRPQRTERVQMRTERQQLRTERVRPARTERVQARVADRQQVRANRANRVERVQTRTADRQLRANRIERVQTRQAERQQLRPNRITQVQNRMAERQQLRAERQIGAQDLKAQRQELRADRQFRAQDLRAQRNVLRAERIANADAFRASRFATLTSLAPRTRVIAPAQAVTFVGQPLSAVTPLVALSPLPSTVSYLYPDTPDYYYQYGGGYLYQVDRTSNLIAALLPLLAGGYMPGTYLPSMYMNSYAPSYYGLNSFYPADYSYGYGSGYGYGSNLCNRYADGVIYQVDCVTGMIVDVIPMYAGGYGVGQMLPSAYNYYNVPYQYRSMYYDTPDYNYWYAPGAIYQYDPGSSMITSVAALLSPGFSVGQPLPMGYSTYNVPYAYRTTYYDTPNAWYRYNNGYIYQVDPTTQIVSAIVASILT